MASHGLLIFTGMAPMHIAVSCSTGSSDAIPTSFCITRGVPVPPNWSISMDPASGNIVYLNSESRSTQWAHPGLLPPGWAKAVDPRGTVYFMNHSTRSTQWTRPVWPSKQQEQQQQQQQQQQQICSVSVPTPTAALTPSVTCAQPSALLVL
jgi:hypothetical protein